MLLGLSEFSKEREIKAQKLTSDGITNTSLLQIYQQVYQRFEVQGETRWLRFAPNRTAQRLQQLDAEYRLTCYTQTT